MDDIAVYNLHTYMYKLHTPVQHNWPFALRSLSNNCKLLSEWYANVCYVGPTCSFYSANNDSAGISS